MARAGTKAKANGSKPAVTADGPWKDAIVGFTRDAPDQLLAHPDNPKIHSRTQMDALDASIRDVGVIGAVTVNDRTGHVLDGHARITLALRRREKTIPVLHVDVDPALEPEALLTFDAVGALAAWDASKLDLLMEDVHSGEAAIQELLADLAKENGLYLGRQAGEDQGPEIDKAAELQAKWQTARGQVWECGRHRLVCGDATDRSVVLGLMDGQQADCVFTSPPYAVGVDYGEYQDTITNLRQMLPKLSQIWRDVVLPGGFAVVNFGDIASGRDVAGSAEPCEYPMAVEYWPVFRTDGWLLWSRRIWCKPNPRVHSPWCIQSNRAATDWEHLWTWRKPGEPIVKRVDGEMRSASGWIDTSQMHGVDVGKETHGAGMALGIAHWMLLVHSREGALIYEPFAGTGTTIVAAEQLGRECRATELEPSFVAVALERLSALGLTPRLVES